MWLLIENISKVWQVVFCSTLVLRAVDIGEIEINTEWLLHLLTFNSLHIWGRSSSIYVLLKVLIVFAMVSDVR